MKQQWKFLLYTTAVLCMSMSCKKDPPLTTIIDDGFCTDGRCCNDTYEFKLFKKIENVRADFDAIGTNYGFAIEGVGSTPICDLCVDKVKDLKVTFDSKNYLKTPYKYRVWGRVFVCTSCTSLRPEGTLFFYVEKVEEVK